MQNEKTSTVVAVVRELFSASLYKRSQGKIARQVTFAVIVAVIGVGCWRLYDVMGDSYGGKIRFGLPSALFLCGMWLAFRLVCLPRLADFLIAVEAEMNKVSWPTRPELTRAVITVIVVVAILGAVLFIYDFAWRFVLRDILKIYGAP